MSELVKIARNLMLAASEAREEGDDFTANVKERLAISFLQMAGASPDEYRDILKILEEKEKEKQPKELTVGQWNPDKGEWET